MQRFHASDGTVIAFSNGAMATLWQAWSLAAAARRSPQTEDEEAVFIWLSSNRDRSGSGFGIAFVLDPPDGKIAAPARLRYLAEVIRFTADDLAGEAPPDEAIWEHEIDWEPERRAHWRARLDALAQLVSAAATRSAG